MNATPVQIVDAIVKYMYNVSPSIIFDAVYGKEYSISYRNEKINTMKNLACWWGELDEEHQDRLVNLALERYKLN